jgi:hypothetical protein
MNKIIAITVSTNYSDLLEFILPQNYKFFYKWYIITSENDQKTIDVINKFQKENIEIIFYDFYKSFSYKSLSIFNKGGAINYVQKLVYNISENIDKLILILDSDIFLPDNFINIIDKINFVDNTLYGPQNRYDYYSYNNFESNLIDSKYSVGGFEGYFQLYKFNSRYLYNNSKDCSICDITFRNKFKNKITISDLIVKHLGKGGVNWKGRKEIDFIK